jgi:hypothetical protein
MAVNSNSERLGYGGEDGCVALGQHVNVISEGVATRTLLSKESGSLVVFDRAAGVTFTLPAPAVGRVFEFGTSVTGTGTYKIITSAATEFLTGGVQIGSETAGGHDSFAADGTAHRSITMDADTKGRIKGGGIVRFVGVSSTVWHVSGWLVGAGTVATPFANS